MPRVQMPLIVGQGAGVYQIIVRIYDVLQDYTEISKDIYVSRPLPLGFQGMCCTWLCVFTETVSCRIRNNNNNVHL